MESEREREIDTLGQDMGVGLKILRDKHAVSIVSLSLSLRTASQVSVFVLCTSKASTFAPVKSGAGLNTFFPLINTSMRTFVPVSKYFGTTQALLCQKSTC